MMEQTQENRSAHGKDANNSPGESTAEQPVISVGHLLREGRERMGWSVEDVVSQIKLAPRQIEALEADDFQSLPETAFVRGFVRSYAKVLKLDERPLLDALPGAKAAHAKPGVPQAGASIYMPQTERQQNIKLLAGAFFVALLIAGFALWQNQAPQRPATDEVKTVSEGTLVSTQVELPAQAEMLAGSGVDAGVAAGVDAGVIAAGSGVVAIDALAASAARPVSAVQAVQAEKVMVENTAVPLPGKLRLVFDKPSWTEIRDKTGKMLAKKVFQSGEELNLEGIAPFSLVVGYAPTAHLYYQGKQVDMTPYINASSDVAHLTLK